MMMDDDENMQAQIDHFRGKDEPPGYCPIKGRVVSDDEELDERFALEAKVQVDMDHDAQEQRNKDYDAAIKDALLDSLSNRPSWMSGNG
jgi:hypothetical protein